MGAPPPPAPPPSPTNAPGAAPADAPVTPPGAPVTGLPAWSKEYPCRLRASVGLDRLQQVVGDLVEVGHGAHAVGR